MNLWELGYAEGFRWGFWIGAISSFFATVALCLIVGAFVNIP